jgi:hypothetical protein
MVVATQGAGFPVSEQGHDDGRTEVSRPFRATDCEDSWKMH